MIKQKRTKKALMILLGCILVYAAIVFLTYIFQYRLLYLPGRTNLDRLRQACALPSLKLWPEDNEQYLGLLPGNTPAPSRGTVIVFHGNAGNAEDRIYYIEPLRKQGFRVLLAEYPGYGAREGSPREATLVEDGKRIIEKAYREFGNPMYLWGESLGCGVASAVVLDTTTKIDGMVLLTPWNTLSATAQAHYWFLPARWLVRDRYDNIRNLQQFHGPIAVVMADQDNVIPNRLTLALYQSIGSPKRLWTFEGTGHNNWPVSPELDWWREVMEFVSGERPIRDTLK